MKQQNLIILVNPCQKNRIPQKKQFQSKTKNSTDQDFTDDIDKKKQRKGKKSRKQNPKSKLKKDVNASDSNVKSSISKKEFSKQETILPSQPSYSAVKKKENQTEVSCLNNSGGSPSITNYPSSDKVYSLTKLKEGFKFTCHICKFDTKSKEYIAKHLNSEDHKSLKNQKEWDKILPYLPKPFPEQVEAISDLLLKYHAEFGLQQKDLEIRKAIALRLKEFVESRVKGCTLEMIGTSVSGLGLKTSNVDFVLKVDPDQDVPDSLENLYNDLLKEPSVSNVQSDFKKKRPGILFKDVDSNLSCSIVIENGFSEKLARLMSMYRQLDYRVHILGTVFRYWAKLCGIDNQDRGTLPAYAYSLLLIHFLQQTSPPVIPVLHEEKDYSKHDFFDECMKGNVWKSENKDSVGDLWIKLFHYYNFIYEKGKHVVCIRSSARMLCSEKNWATKFYAIEDPYVRRNIAHVIPNFQVCNYIHTCFLRTYKYFAFPQLKTGEVKLWKSEAFEEFLLTEAATVEDSFKECSSDESSASETEDLNFAEDFEDQDPDLSLEHIVSALKDMNLVENSEETVETFPQTSANISEEQNKSSSPEKESKKKSDKSSKVNAKNNVQNFCAWDIGKRRLYVADFNYEMNAVEFKGKKDVPFCCKICKSNEHLKKNCPVEDLPEESKLPEMTSEFLKVLNKVLHYIRDKFCIDIKDKIFIESNMQDIEIEIQKLFSEANLSMFGSFCNGFGFKGRSDMDFCLTFKDKTDIKDLDCTDIIEKIAKQLRQFPKLKNIVSVTTAKVPIVKFAWTESGLEGDISLYNTLAIVNTEMLEAYSRIDPRVQILGFALKYFAKLLGICDASRGSLSSYAYILMVIYFLQQRKPPVIPVLQELHEDKKPTNMIDGWNVWFFKDYEKLPEVWPDYGKNRESVGELWLGLLSFYAYEFDWKEYVVSIRQKSLLTRFKKLWITDQIAIEDPFDLSHNLGAGLSRKMNLYILKAFIRGRERFGTPLPIERLLNISGHEVTYLFDRFYLSNGSEPPHDRGCRICGKIGHFAKKCTQEKACMYCKKTGHLIKNCPYKNSTKKKTKNIDRKPQETLPFSENITISHQSHPLTNQDETFTSIDSSHRMAEDSRKKPFNLLQLGLPMHRHPPPGFHNKNPPPGFASKMPIHRNGTIFPPPFSSSTPVPFPPRTPSVNELPHNPHKHFNCSPPKNCQGNKQYHSSNQVLLRHPRPGLLPEPCLPPADTVYRGMMLQRAPSVKGQFPNRW